MMRIADDRSLLVLTCTCVLMDGRPSRVSVVHFVSMSIVVVLETIDCRCIDHFRRQTVPTIDDTLTEEVTSDI